MSEHGEIVLQKPISEYAKYLKSLIPRYIPNSYALKPIFETVASEKEINSGILAYRDFLYLFCDCLITDGNYFAKPQKTRNPLDYPFLNNINNFLIDIGFYSVLNDSKNALLVAEIPSFLKISKPKQNECIQFLILCGFQFTDLDMNEKKVDITEIKKLEVKYPQNPILLIGLKALSISSMRLKVRFYNNASNILRCDYRVMMAEETDIFFVLKDILHPLPEAIQNFAFDLHNRYINKGMTCTIIYDDAIHFAYANIKNSKRTLSPRDIYQLRLWELAISMKNRYSIVIRSKKIEKHYDMIKTFPLSLQEKIKNGYGCDRKLRNERCQGGCQGIRLSLDASILDMKQDIIYWLDHEI